MANKKVRVKLIKSAVGAPYRRADNVGAIVEMDADIAKLAIDNKVAIAVDAKAKKQTAAAKTPNKETR